MKEFEILIVGGIIQFIVYFIVGIYRKDFKIEPKVLIVSIVGYLIIGIGLTILNSIDSYELSQSNDKVFKPLMNISIIGNFINIGIFGLSFLGLNFLKVIIKILIETGYFSFFSKIFRD